tara:strand:+ start:155 stop:634 length:480 start_codon:yes stop_codon:yes gene_type:complete
MDDELRRIITFSAIGGLFGWVNAKSKVFGICESYGSSYPYEYENLCDSSREGQLVLNSAIDLVYPSSILTGLAIGFFLGVIYANLRPPFDAFQAQLANWRKVTKARPLFKPKATKAPPPPSKPENFVCDCGFSDPNAQVMVEHKKMCQWSKSGAGLESH